MKKLLFAFAAAVLTAAIPLSAYAEAPAEPPAEQTPVETRPEDMFTYTVNVAGRAEITDFTVSDTFTGELVIPSQLDGHDVGYIDNAAFMNAKGMTSVTIPASVEDMGNSVFFGCENLEKIHVEAGNTYFAEIDDGVLVADNQQFLVAYPAARAGENYPIPDTIDEIAPGCFGFAKNLKEITIPQKVQYIDKWAFAYSKLEKVNISSMQIDDYAFAYCDALHEVVLNSGLESIYNAAFSVCPALTEIHFPDTLTYIGQCAFSGTGLTSVSIPASVNEIDYCAFGYDADLHTVGGFVIYGQSGSEAEYYASAVDPDNDYENHFTFIAEDISETQSETVQETSEALSEVPEVPEVMTVTEINEDGQIVIEEITAPPGTSLSSSS